MYFKCSFIVLDNSITSYPEEQSTPIITIRRRSGRLEKFDIEKMALDIGRAGAPYLLAKEVSRAISNKIHEKAINNAVIDTKGVRQMIVEELRARNRPDIASSFAGERPMNATEQKYTNNKGEPVHDHVAVHRGNLLYDSSTHFAKTTKGEGIKK